jgi:hypothetical protein
LLNQTLTDVQYLREQAKENITEYVTQHLPEQYQVCLSALDTVLKNAFVIMTKSEDNREKLQAMELFKNTHLVKLELLSNATTIDSALQYIKGKQQQKKQGAKGSQNANLSEQEEDTTTPASAAEATGTGKQSVF